MFKQYFLTCDNLLFVGDLHGVYTTIFNLLNNGNIENTIFIPCGDFGVGFGGDEEKILLKLNRRLQKKNNKIFVIRGNHDNPSYFNPNKSKYSNITFLEDYTVLTITVGCNVPLNILSIGGATSIDRTSRTKDFSWWSDELFIYDEDKLNEILKTIKSIDIVCTHTAPSIAYPHMFSNRVSEWSVKDKTLKTDLLNERWLVNNVYLKLKEYGLKKWYYGHYHESYNEIIDNCNFILLNINEVK